MSIVLDARVRDIIDREGIPQVGGGKETNLYWPYAKRLEWYADKVGKTVAELLALSDDELRQTLWSVQPVTERRTVRAEDL